MGRIRSKGGSQLLKISGVAVIAKKNAHVIPPTQKKDRLYSIPYTVIQP
jgi:hypothetical protein